MKVMDMWGVADQSTSIKLNDILHSLRDLSEIVEYYSDQQNVNVFEYDEYANIIKIHNYLEKLQKKLVHRNKEGIAEIDEELYDSIFN